MIRVVLAEDQAMVLGALSALLELEGDIEVVALARDGDEAQAKVRETRPDVLVTDIEMPGRSGLDLAVALADEGCKTRVVIVTTFARPGYLRRALDAGASGYLLKDAPAEALADGIRHVHRGGRAISPELAAAAWTAPTPLTERERSALRLAGRGLTTAQIARELGLSPGTVRNYLSEAIGKLGSSNRVEAARRAEERGWL